MVPVLEYVLSISQTIHLILFCSTLHYMKEAIYKQWLMLQKGSFISNNLIINKLNN